MSRIVERCLRRRVRVVCGILLASVTLAAVNVSVAAASGPPTAPDGPTVDEDGNTVLASGSIPGPGEYIVQLEPGTNVDEVVDDVAADGVEVTRHGGGRDRRVHRAAGPPRGGRVARPRRRGAGGAPAGRTRSTVCRTVRRGVWTGSISGRGHWTRKYSYRNTGVGVDVYVIDSGIRKTHSEFTGRLKPGAYIDFGDGNGINDCSGHGTHVAGTIGGTTWGVAKQVAIRPVNVFKCGERSASTSDLVIGINWVIDEPPGRYAGGRQHEHRWTCVERAR